jgi:hypothetical protein
MGRTRIDGGAEDGKPQLITSLVLDFLTNEPVATVAPIRRAAIPEG